MAKVNETKRLVAGALVAILLLAICIAAGFRSATAQSEHETTWRAGDMVFSNSYCNGPAPLEGWVKATRQKYRVGLMVIAVHSDECKMFPAKVAMQLLAFHSGPYTQGDGKGKWSIWQVRVRFNGQLAYAITEDSSGPHKRAIGG